MGHWIWFNLLLFSNGHWVYVDSLETLEDCSDLRMQYEEKYPGNYYCLPIQVIKI